MSETMIDETDTAFFSYVGIALYKANSSGDKWRGSI